MSRKKKIKPVLKNIHIDDFAAEGQCVARVDGMVVFVPFAVPGDICDLQVRRKKRSFAEADILRLIEPSPMRIEPRCPHFGVCGGCKWQNIPYEEQLKMKQRQVIDQLTRIGHLTIPEPLPILGSACQWEYRNKLDFGFSNRRWLTSEEIASGKPLERNALGFHIPGAFDKIYPISRCLLMDPLNNNIRNEVFRYALERHLSFFDLRSQHGLLRDLIMRNNSAGEWMTIFQFHYDGPDDDKRAEDMMEHIHTSFPQITSILYLNNQKCNDTINDQNILVYAGQDHIVEEMEGLRFKVGPKSFYQTNTEQAHRLYRAVRDMAALKGDDLVYDLYTGTGTIANFIARGCARQVIGIEYVAEAIEDAKENSRLNGIDNTLFYAGDMKDVLNDNFILCHGRPDVIITDPPRAGMHGDVVKTILRALPQRIVYVSCNPATQARDLALLSERYTIEAIQSVDMFPHTPHIENITSLILNT